MVQEHLDGTIHMVYKDRDVLFAEIKELPRRPMVTQQKQQSSKTKEEIRPSSGSPMEKTQSSNSMHQPGITGVRSPEDISKES